MILSLFPEILFLAPFSAFFIRLALGGIFLYTAWHHMARADILIKVLAAAELGIGVTLIAGSWTQVSALLGAVAILVWFWMPKLHRWPLSTLLLALIMCASLIITGAGALAFDLPL